MMIPKVKKHNRVKPRRAAEPTPPERIHMDRVHSFGCLVCGMIAEIHHIMHMADKRMRRDHRYLVPLCSHHHRSHEGVHGLGSEAKFMEVYKVDLVAWAVNAWSESCPD
jgi:hypothetical protein